MRFVFERLDFMAHQLIEFHGIDAAADHQPQVVGDEAHDHRIVGDSRVFTEQRAFGGVFNVLFHTQHALAAHLGEQVVLQRHQLHVDLFVVLLGALEAAGGTQGGFDRLAVIGGHERPHRGPDDHQDFGGLVERAQVSAGHGEAAEHGKGDDNEAKRYQHNRYPSEQRG